MANTTFTGPVRSLNGFVGALTGNVTGNITTAPAAVTSATATIDSTYAGKTIYMNRAAGAAVTLPAALGTGNVYTFVLAATATGDQVVKVANATDTMIGSAHVVSDNSAAVLGYIAGSTADTITLNGTTTGGASAGDTIIVRDIATAKWAVQVFSTATSTEATPFSATVS